MTKHTQAVKLQSWKIQVACRCNQYDKGEQAYGFVTLSVPFALSMRNTDLQHHSFGQAAKEQTAQYQHPAASEP